MYDYLPSHFVYTVQQSPAFDCCTGCSKRVVDKYREDGFGLLKHLAENPSYIEELSGINQLTADVNEDDLMFEDDFQQKKK